MKEGKVSALALSGGGSKGAFTGGMLQYMKMEKGMEFDLYSGTSTGTLLQTLTSINKFDLLKEAYTSITLDDIYKSSPFKQGDDPENPKINIAGLLKMHFIEKEPTFGDSSNLKDLIRKFFPEELFEESLAAGKTLIAAVSNLDTAKTETYSSRDVSYEEFCDWTWISCNAVPFTSLVKRNDMYYADGGFTEHMPICRLIEMGATDITAITTKPMDYKPVTKDLGKNPLSLLSRLIDVLLWEASERDLEVVRKMALEQDVTLNVYYMPRTLTDNSMYFDKALMNKWWDEGYEHAKELFDGHKNSSKAMMAKKCCVTHRFTKHNEFDANVHIKGLKNIQEKHDLPGESLHVVSGDGIIRWANHTELEKMGYSKEDYIGKSIKDFHKDEVVIDDILERLLSGETLENYPARLKAKDGSIKEVLINSSGSFEGEEFSHTRCFTRDVTDFLPLDDKIKKNIRSIKAKKKK